MNIKIYALIDPLNGELRYVGVTKRPLKERLDCHIYEARYHRNMHRAHWINSLGGMRPEIFLLEENTDREAELFWIAYFKGLGCRLTNATSGGDGVLNPTDEVRKRMGNGMRGKKHTEETRKKMRDSHLGIVYPPITEEQRARLSEAHMGKLLSEDHKAKLSLTKSYPVRCIETNQMFYSVKEAAISYGVSTVTLLCSIKSGKKIRKGFSFCRAGENYSLSSPASSI